MTGNTKKKKAYEKWFCDRIPFFIRFLGILASVEGMLCFLILILV